MRKFFFRLQPLLEVRTTQRDLKAGDVARLLGESEEQAEKLYRLQNKWEESCRKTSVLEQDTLLYAQYYREQVQKDIEEQKILLAEKEKKLQTAREQLLQAEIACSSLELLKEKEKNRYYREALKEEQLLLDEAGVNGFLRNAEKG